MATAELKLAHLAPQATELEQLVLGACMIERGAYKEIADILDQEHFYSEPHKLIYMAIRNIYPQGKVDIVTVMQWLRDRKMLEEVGGAIYISSLTNKVVSSAHVQYHARIIQQKFIQRTLQGIGSMLENLDESEDVFDLMDKVNERIGKVNAIVADKDANSAAEIAGKMMDSTEKPLYIRANMGPLDDHFAMGPGQVAVIGARPGIGKTSFALNIAMNVARQGYKSLFISLEMTEQELVARMVSSLTGIDAEKMTRNEITDAQRTQAAAAVTKHGAMLAHILIDDRAVLKSAQLFGLFERAKMRHDVKVVFIDYLQLMASGDEDNRYEKITAISIACKQAAKATGLRLVEISQLKRRDGADMDPQLSDLRESGQVEQDAHVALLLGRQLDKNLLRVKVAKNRGGPVGKVDLSYDLVTQKITDDFRDDEIIL